MIRRPAFALLLGLAGLTACQTPVEQWQPVEAPKANKVELVRLNHTVRFAPGSANLSTTETQRLNVFLRDSEPQSSEQVVLAAAPGDRLGAARQTVIRQMLGRRGIPPTAPTSDTAPIGQRGGGDEVMLAIERYVVTPPGCPNWSKPAGGDPTNTTASNFGCATATNLGLMVAEPRDLLIGRKPGPPDAEPTILAIQNYRAAKPILLPEGGGPIQPAAGGGGGGGGGSGAGAGGGGASPAPAGGG
jgi:pilus assembly protein CpaD